MSTAAPKTVSLVLGDTLFLRPILTVNTEISCVSMLAESFLPMSMKALQGLL